MKVHILNPAAWWGAKGGFANFPPAREGDICIEDEIDKMGWKLHRINDTLGGGDWDRLVLIPLETLLLLFDEGPEEPVDDPTPEVPAPVRAVEEKRPYEGTQTVIEHPLPGFDDNGRLKPPKESRP